MNFNDEPKLACNHNSRGWRPLPNQTDNGDGGWRCVDCGLILCSEFINGDLRSPNGKRPFGHEFCNRVATIVGTWKTTDGKPMKSYVCGIHRRRLHVWNDPQPQPFENVKP